MLNYKYILIFLSVHGIGMSLQAKRSKFPFQNAHRFTNHDYASGKYCLDEITFNSIEPNQRFSFTDGLKDLIFKDPLSKNPVLAIQKDITYKGPRYTFSDNKWHKGLVVRKYGNKKGDTYSLDQIIFYVWTTTNYKGSKVIFDVDKFERYMTQTWEFDNLPKQEDSDHGPALGQVCLSYGFNAKSFDFSGIPLDSIINITYTMRNPSAYNTYVDDIPLSQWRTLSKDEKTLTKDFLVKEGIITVLDMSRTDFAEVR